MRNSNSVLHLIHSRRPETGGVCSAVELLNEELVKQGVQSRISDDPNALVKSTDEWLIAHGLWQWPGRRAQGSRNRYLVYPHGMLDPWFKKTYPLKHLKKQLYWWVKQGSILRDAAAVCFTTEEERLLAQKTFFPYRAKEVVTGLGMTTPPEQTVADTEKFHQKFLNLKDKKFLLYLGRFHPKKGVDDLIRAWKNRKKKEDEVLVLAGPLEKENQWIKNLQNLAKEDTSVVWTDMLKSDLKWSALRFADAMILPSHQENYGMVVAEACSVGLPVYLTDKVNLWREVENAGAGTVESDTPKGIENLVNQWSVSDRDKLSMRAQKCFTERLHISRTVENLIEVMEQPAT